jgi:hypothetical protein
VREVVFRTKEDVLTFARTNEWQMTLYSDSTIAETIAAR